MSSLSNSDVAVHHKPTFTVEPVHLQFDLKGTLRQVLVQNDILYLIRTTTISRIDLSRPSNVSNFPLPQSKSALKGCWLHPDGNHLVIAFEDLTFYYLHSTYRRFKPLAKLKGLDVSSVEFLDSSSGPNADSLSVLLLCNDRTIHLASIKAHDSTQENKRDDKHLKQVYKSTSKLLGAHLSNNGTRIAVVTSLQVLHWDCFELTFAELVSVFKLAPVSQALPSSVGAKSIFRDLQNGWLLLDPESNKVVVRSHENMHSKSLPTPKGYSKYDLASVLSSKHHLMVLNDKHDRIGVISILTNELITEINLEDIASQTEPVLGLALDSNSLTFWLYNSGGLFEIVVVNESISIWYDYYKLGNYEEALKCIESNDPSAKFKIDFIHIKQGYDLLQKGLFGTPALSDFPDNDAVDLQIKGIRKLGELNEPFEKVCLMLLNVQDAHNCTNVRALNLSNTLLIEYLLTKFNSAKQKPNSVILAVLSTWIVELLLRQMYTVSSALNLAPETSEASDCSELKSESERITNQFYTFLKSNDKYLDPTSIYQVLKDLCLLEQLVYFAELKQDYQYLVSYHLEMFDWAKALKYLISFYIADEAKAVKCVYSTATILLINSPKQTVDTWLKFDALKFEELLPSIMVFNKNNKSVDYSENHTLRYMRKLIADKGVRDPLVNNTLLSLLITYPERQEESEALLSKQLVRLLNQFKSDNNNAGSFDADLILRLCLTNDRHEAAVVVLINEKGLYFDALQLALSVKSINMAELVLRKFEQTSSNQAGIDNNKHVRDKVDHIGLEYNEYITKRDLWLRFAKFLISDVTDDKLYKDIVDKINEQDTSSKISVDVDNDTDEVRLKRILKYLLDLSANIDKMKVLTIKDLLPLFPQSILVNNFKEEIVDSLNEYNDKISELGNELNSSLATSKKLRSQVKDTFAETNRGTIHTIIEPGEPCRLCNNLLINKNFVCFPNCHHAFHKDCIARYFLQLRGDYQFKRIFLEFKKNASLASREELDSLMTKGCILCSMSVIDGIDNDLLADANTVESAWAL